MKLYELPRRTWITVQGINDDKPFYFWNVDGMYSRCSLDTDSAEFFHLAAWTEAERSEEPPVETT